MNLQNAMTRLVLPCVAALTIGGEAYWPPVHFV